MRQTATFFIIEKKDLELLEKEGKEETAVIKRRWFEKPKKPASVLSRRLEAVAVEKVNFRWAGLAFVIMAVFSREKLGADWDNLKYSHLANQFFDKTEGGIYIFSIHDQELLKLKPNGYYYTMGELEQFAIEFEGNKPGNPDIMKDTVKVLDEALSKITMGNIVVLLIE